MGCSDTIKSDAEDFAACGRRVSFWMPRKKPKRHQGAAQVVRRGALYPETFPHFRRGGEFLSGCPERNQRGTKARLKLCVGGRYILRHSLISVGAAHWAARRGGRLRSHPHLSRFACHLPPCRGKAFGRVLDPPLRRIWERPRYSHRGRSGTGPRAHTVRPYDGKRTSHQDRSPHPSGLRPATFP